MWLWLHNAVAAKPDANNRIVHMISNRCWLGNTHVKPGIRVVAVVHRGGMGSSGQRERGRYTGMPIGFEKEWKESFLKWFGDGQKAGRHKRQARAWNL